jgi:hypothetical protein
MTATDRVTAAAFSARPYVQRAITDEELRESVKSAFQAFRDVYGELVGDRGISRVASRLASDEDVQDNLRTAIAELRNAADRLQAKEHESRKGRIFVALGLMLLVLFNPLTGPGTRKWIKSKLFGGGDDYAYATGNGSV